MPAVGRRLTSRYLDCRNCSTQCLNSIHNLVSLQGKKNLSYHRRSEYSYHLSVWGPHDDFDQTSSSNDSRCQMFWFSTDIGLPCLDLSYRPLVLNQPVCQQFHNPCPLRRFIIFSHILINIGKKSEQVFSCKNIYFRVLICSHYFLHSFFLPLECFILWPKTMVTKVMAHLLAISLGTYFFLPNICEKL